MAGASRLEQIGAGIVGDQLAAAPTQPAVGSGQATAQPAQKDASVDGGAGPRHPMGSLVSVGCRQEQGDRRAGCRVVAAAYAKPDRP
jgi:hypothetical protein